MFFPHVSYQLNFIRFFYLSFRCFFFSWTSFQKKIYKTPFLFFFFFFFFVELEPLTWCDCILSIFFRFTHLLDASFDRIILLSARVWSCFNPPWSFFCNHFIKTSLGRVVDRSKEFSGVSSGFDVLAQEMLIRVDCSFSIESISRCYTYRKDLLKKKRKAKTHRDGNSFSQSWPAKAPWPPRPSCPPGRRAP